ncbi:MAG: hypothetical protein ACXWPS_03315 [Ktedonobacteraceae bacterium]
MRSRPIGVTILAILAGIAAVLAAVHALQFLGIFPFFFSPLGLISMSGMSTSGMR